MFLKVIFRNLTQNPMRSLAGSGGIALGVCAMISILSIVFGAMHRFQRILAEETHLLVFEKNVSDLFFSNVPEDTASTLESMPEVASAYPLLFGLVSTEGHPVITCFGLSAQDARLRKARWESGSLDAFKDGKGVLLGVRAASFLKPDKDQRVEIGKSTFAVVGVIATENGFEDGGVFMPLKMAQDYFHKERAASVIAVKLHKEEHADRVIESLQQRNPALKALRNEDFRRTYSQFKIMSATAWAVGFCAFALGGMSVFNTMLMSVYNRIREIAVLRVCGFSRCQIAGLILGESLALSLVGLSVGSFGGFLLLLTLEKIPALQGYISPHAEGWMFVSVPIVAVVTCLLGSLYPMWIAIKVQPSEALRYE